MVKILTDSCSDLSPELIRQYDIEVIDLQVNINEHVFLDSHLSQKQLFDYVKETGELPKTSARSVNDFIEFFVPYDEIIYIGIGDKLSATFQSATLAKNELNDKNIKLINSNNLSTGIGQLIIRAAELNYLEKPIEEIETDLLKTIPKVKTSFAIDTLDYLYKGGRCSAMTNIVGSLLKIHPIIEVKNDGSLGVKDKIRGSRKKSIQAMIDSFKENLEQINLNHVFITHTGSDEEALFISDSLREIAHIKNLHITRAGSVIASHCGPNTFGIIYLEK